MRISGRLFTRRVSTEEDRQRVLEVLRVTYQIEKAWLSDVGAQFPAGDLQRDDISWFLTMRRGEPIGVLRVLYDPPLAQYLKYDLKALDHGIDVAAFIASGRIAEVGRFAVVPECRRGVLSVLSLIRAAFREIVTRGCTQLITDVFENDPHSPYRFHTRVFGFRPVATHETGELHHEGRRITLVLDIKAAHRRLRLSRLWRRLTRGWGEATHQLLAT